MLFGKCHYKNESRVKYYIRVVLGTLYPGNKVRIKKLLEQESRKYENEKSDIVRGAGFKFVYFDKSKLSELSEYEFEGKKIKGIKDYDYVLRLLYSDYMNLPPEEERYNYHHKILSVSFGIEN